MKNQSISFCRGIKGEEQKYKLRDRKEGRSQDKKIMLREVIKKAGSLKRKEGRRISERLGERVCFPLGVWEDFG